MYAKTNISNANCSETIETMKMVEFSLKSIEKILGKRNRPFFWVGGGGDMGDGETGKGVWNLIRNQIRYVNKTICFKVNTYQSLLKRSMINRNFMSVDIKLALR